MTPDRELSDPREMRALTHPVRLALIEVLGNHGPMTATEAGELIGESPTTCSFHLRQLEKYGFVEEAGGGVGRRRPWQLVSRGMRFSGGGDAEQTVAADELARLLMDRWLQRHEQWQNTQHTAPEWAELTGVWQHTVYASPDELAQLNIDVNALMDRFKGRLDDATRRPGNARVVEFVLFNHLLVTPAPRSATDGGTPDEDGEDAEP